MNTQTEQQLENALIAQLQTLGWEKVTISDEADLVANLKMQLGALVHLRNNKIDLTQLQAVCAATTLQGYTAGVIQNADLAKERLR